MKQSVCATATVLSLNQDKMNKGVLDQMSHNMLAIGQCVQSSKTYTIPNEFGTSLWVSKILSNVYLEQTVVLHNFQYLSFSHNIQKNLNSGNLQGDEYKIPLNSASQQCKWYNDVSYFTSETTYTTQNTETSLSVNLSK